MGSFKPATNNLSNDTPYAYSITDQIKIHIFLDLDTGVNKLSHGTRIVQNMIAFNSPTDTPFAYINTNSQIKGDQTKNRFLRAHGNDYGLC